MRFQLEWSIFGWDPLTKLLLQRLLKLGSPTTDSFYLNDCIYLSWAYVCVAREKQRVIIISICSQEIFYPAWTEVPCLKFDTHSALQNCQSLESEDFTDILNTSLRRFHRPYEHKSRHWTTYKIASFQLEFSPILISLLHFPCGISLSLLGSASSRVPTPLNSDVTSSLPVARVTPITNILHFSLVCR